MAENEMLQGTAGRFGIAEQTAFDTPESNDANFHYIAFTGCDFAPVQMTGALPTESGATSALPQGLFKSGVHAEGGVDFIPRLEESIGYWLKAVFGDASKADNQNISQAIAESGTTTGVYSHRFVFDNAFGSSFDLPYLTSHRWLPHTTAADQVGEILQDVRIQNWALQANAAAVVSASADMLGRANGTTIFDMDPGWSAPTLDNSNTFLVSSCAGSVQVLMTGGVPGTLTEIDVSVVGLNVTNVLLPPNRSRRVGSPHPKDYPVMSRAITLTTVVYLEDYDLYVQMFAGAASPVVDAAWSCTPLSGDIDVTLLSPVEIGSTGEYFQMRFRTSDGNVKWSARPLVLVPNQPVLLAMTGLVTPATTASTYDFEMWIQNDHATAY
jgi:hypothetical protein